MSCNNSSYSLLDYSIYIFAISSVEINHNNLDLPAKRLSCRSLWFALHPQQENWIYKIKVNLLQFHFNMNIKKTNKLYMKTWMFYDMFLYYLSLAISTTITITNNHANHLYIHTYIHTFKRYYTYTHTHIHHSISTTLFSWIVIMKASFFFFSFLFYFIHIRHYILIKFDSTLRY